MTQAVHVNNAPHPAPHEHAAITAALSVPVWVSQTPSGAAITQVKQSTFSQTNAYWLNLSSSTSIKSAVFTVIFKAGSPLVDQIQVFSFPSGYAGGITTPFGVPFWGGNPILGPATLKVQTDHGLAGTYGFTIIA